MRVMLLFGGFFMEKAHRGLTNQKIVTILTVLTVLVQVIQ